ncbi:hypothetical protein TNCV_4542631 [Trichonephila clavipes]|nr:hypothetical protein TNCV_4542631 [Trichonephila clavipes]
MAHLQVTNNVLIIIANPLQRVQSKCIVALDYTNFYEDCCALFSTLYKNRMGKFNAKIVGVEIGGVALYHPIGEFRRANSYCHLYGAQDLGQRQTYF